MRPLLIGHMLDHRRKHFARAACRADDQSLAIRLNDRPWQPRLFIVIIQVGIGNQLVNILQTLLRLCQNDDVMGRLALVIYAAILLHTVRIVKDIALHAVDDLDFAAFFALFFCLRRAVRERLHHAMIGHRDRRLSPLGCHRHDVLRFVEAVHLAHLGVDMQFDTPAVLPGILAVDCAVGLFEILEHDRIHILKGIPLHLAAQLDPVTGFKQFIDFLPFVLADERLGADRRLVVSDQQRDEIIPALDDAL